MYNPPAFAKTDAPTLFDFIERHSFGMLVSQHDGEPFVSHLPFLVDRAAAVHGRLIGHTARENPQWRQADGTPVLVVFPGPQAYISPTWYQDSNVVPTWNYVTVHARGRLRAIHDPGRILEIVAQTVVRFESSLHVPWTFDSASESAGGLARQIVGFEIDLASLEGKWKLSQNHSAQRQASVIQGLRHTGQADAREIAELMQASLSACSGQE